VPKYKIGYKKPPEKYRFKPGQSGNPHGRPKSTKNLTKIIQEELDRRIFDADGKKISVKRGLIKMMIRDAARDPKARKLLVDVLLNWKGLLPW
jgi:hypothetical protein